MQYNPRGESEERHEVELAAVLVADRDKAFRAGVAELVAHAGLRARTAATGDEALASARTDRPSAVVLDVGLREMSGYETCRALREMFGETLPILFVSSERTEPSDRVAGLLLGADDYLAKPVDRDELLARIRRAATRSIAQARDMKTNGSLHATRGGSMQPESIAGLTAREIEVLRLMAVGQTPRQISDKLVISPKTVSSHLQRILTKLAVHSRLQAVVLAYELGLVSPGGDGPIKFLS
jgi:DNA-binding NarL/FixJ family response regulator